MDPSDDETTLPLNKDNDCPHGFYWGHKCPVCDVPTDPADDPTTPGERLSELAAIRAELIGVSRESTHYEAEAQHYMNNTEDLRKQLRTVRESLGYCLSVIDPRFREDPRTLKAREVIVATM